MSILSSREEGQAGRSQPLLRPSCQAVHFRVPCVTQGPACRAQEREGERGGASQEERRSAGMPGSPRGLDLPHGEQREVPHGDGGSLPSQLASTAPWASSTLCCACCEPGCLTPPPLLSWAPLPGSPGSGSVLAPSSPPPPAVVSLSVCLSLPHMLRLPSSIFLSVSLSLVIFAIHPHPCPLLSPAVNSSPSGGRPPGGKAVPWATPPPPPLLRVPAS